MISRRSVIFVSFLVLCLGWQGCSHNALDEAQRVVAEADSLWHEGKMYGIDAGDSLSLAQAYETLGKYSAYYAFVHRTSLLATYAHACYHYGRLLRKKDDPVAAMQVFINATHSRTDDLHILGRIYSNMGSICHLAGEYPLSYDMYEKSAEIYLQNGDTLLYFYDLNNMAFELAEQRKEEETMALLSEIVGNCQDKELRTQTFRTKALLYRTIGQYEAMLSAIDSLYQLSAPNSSDIVLKAQAFWNLGEKDSALCYAREVMELSDASMQDRYNMVYIIMNGDSTLTNDVITDYSAQRSDIEIYFLIPLHNKLAVAMAELRKDLNHKPDLRWVYAIMITALLTGGAFYWRYRVRKQQMRSQVEQMIERQNDNVTQSIKQHIDVNDLTQTLHWKNYAAMKADADLYIGGIVSKLEKQNLNETEIRFCLLTMLNFSLSRTAETIHYSYPSGIKTLKKRISVKLGTRPPILRKFLFDLASKA